MVAADVELAKIIGNVRPSFYGMITHDININMEVSAMRF